MRLSVVILSKNRKCRAVLRGVTFCFASRTRNHPFSFCSQPASLTFVWWDDADDDDWENKCNEGDEIMRGSRRWPINEVSGDALSAASFLWAFPFASIFIHFSRREFICEVRERSDVHPSHLRIEVGMIPLFFCWFVVLAEGPIKSRSDASVLLSHSCMAHFPFQVPHSFVSAT